MVGLNVELSQLQARMEEEQKRAKATAKRHQKELADVESKIEIVLMFHEELLIRQAAADKRSLDEASTKYELLEAQTSRDLARLAEGIVLALRRCTLHASQDWAPR